MRKKTEKKKRKFLFGFLSRLLQPLLFLALLLFIVLTYTQLINLTNADLGRHIKNGEIFFQQGKPITTNFYSFSEPDYPTINHHWLAGVAFYLITKWAGFCGLSLFYTLLFLLAFCLFFHVSVKMSNFPYALFFSILAVPLITSREEIRPEGFSYLFSGIYFWLLYKFKMKEIGFKPLWIIPFLQVLWVNIHIFFIMGLVMIGVFFFDSWCHEKNHLRLKQYFWLSMVTLALCFLNPFGLKGVLAPLTILKEYGYMLAENQSVIFMQKRFPANMLYPHFEVLWVICLLSFVFVFFKGERKKHILPLLLIVFFSLLSWKAIRGIPLFGLFFIPCVANNFYCLLQRGSYKVRNAVDKLFLFLFIVIIFSSVYFKDPYYSPYEKLHWTALTATTQKSQNWLGFLLKNPKSLFGLIPGVNASADFFKQNRIEGPIFNNYDIGGYLIYHLFPGERVFVDNRPEAYSVSFFKKIYIPMQEDEAMWAKMDERYQFNAIYFFRHDMTPWAQPFLIKRIEDPLWAPIFVDDYTIIFVKRNEKNGRLIRLYELPKRIFSIGKNS